ncbi:hypothetical protein [Pseudobutyrivibrio sp.]|uniref:hypothetical protein n=1 Tax=Pseudobutyrivibrio sp. TaxID=2014367 RepID=UPI0025FA8A00|nr:hypothetical protein [Pseudobutyrivibrio sp.]
MKHLHKKIIAHNSFCSLLHNLAALVIIPVFLIPFALVIMLLDNYLGIVIMMTLLSCLTVLVDYSSFNGITAKGFFLGIIKTSTHVDSFMKDAILADQIRRFIQLAIPPILSLIIAAFISSNGTDIRLSTFIAAIIFLDYSITTGTLIFTRNILSANVHALISLPLTAIIGALNTGMMFLFIHDSIHIPSIIWLSITFILSIMISVWAFSYTTDRCLTNIKEY